MTDRARPTTPATLSVTIDRRRHDTGVHRVEIVERVAGHTEAKVTFRAEEPPAGHGARIRVAPSGQRGLLFDGVVSGVEMRFHRDRHPEAVLTAHTASLRLQRTRRVRSFRGMSEVDIIGAIAREHGLRLRRAIRDEFPKIDAVLGRTGTDWDTITGIARRLGLAVYVRGITMYLDEWEAGRRPRTVAMGREVRELHLAEHVGSLGDPSRVTLWDAGAAATGTAVAEKSLTEAVRAARLRPQDAATAVGGTGDEERAAALARAAARRQRRALARGSARLEGGTMLRAGDWLAIEGASERYRGPHLLAEVVHLQDPIHGWVVDVVIGGEPDPEPGGAPDKGGPCGCGSGVYGVVVGATDPLGQGRVEVSFPWAGEDVVAWARRAVPDAGDGAGTWYPPEPGDEVWVEFEAGDPEQPVVLGSLWNGANQPPSDDRDLRLFRSRRGHVVSIDDQADTIRVARADGGEVVVDGSGIALTTPGDIVLDAGGDVKIESGARSVVKAGSSILIDGTSNVDVVAGSTLDLDASLIEIN